MPDPSLYSISTVIATYAQTDDVWTPAFAESE